MNYKVIVSAILRKLERGRPYVGNEYVVDCIQYIFENEDSYAPVTKILYVEVAKHLHTSSNCVEKGIRNVIRIIWENKEDAEEELIKAIFGSCGKEHRPSNLQFLLSLYDYIQMRKWENSYSEQVFCPATGKLCKYYGTWINEELTERKE